MRFKTFGNTGLLVSEMALGTWGIGGAGWDSYTDDSRLNAIHAALEQGVNLIDTAPAYNAGAAERYIGTVLKDRNARSSVYIATKCGTEYINGGYVRDCSAPTILRQCEESLRNLQTDYIDFYLIHWPDVKVSLEETMDALNTLKKQGKILHIGVSNFNQQQILEAEQYGNIDVCQLQYSMVSQSAQVQLQWAADRGMGTMTYGSLGGGILSGAIRTLETYAADDSRNRFYPYFKEPAFSKIMKLLSVMDQISENRSQVPLSQIAINWAAQKPFVSTCIVGSQSRAKIEENAAGFDWVLTEDELKALDDAMANYLGKDF